LLFVGVMTGIVGLATYVIMLGLIVRRCRAGWRSPRAFPQERALCLGAAAATIAILIHSIFVNSLLVNFVMQELWVLWGLTFVVVAAMRRRA
jgi:O-antigen ligase